MFFFQIYIYLYIFIYKIDEDSEDDRASVVDVSANGDSLELEEATYILDGFYSAPIKLIPIHFTSWSGSCIQWGVSASIGTSLQRLQVNDRGSTVLLVNSSNSYSKRRMCYTYIRWKCSRNHVQSFLEVTKVSVEVIASQLKEMAIVMKAMESNKLDARLKLFVE